METSGNKIRKLEFLLADAVAQGADCIVTCGGIQSNHCRATAAVARMLGLDSFLLLRTSKPEEDPALVGNLLFDRYSGGVDEGMGEFLPHVWVCAAVSACWTRPSSRCRARSTASTGARQ